MFEQDFIKWTVNKYFHDFYSEKVYFRGNIMLRAMEITLFQYSFFYRHWSVTRYDTFYDNVDVLWKVLGYLFFYTYFIIVVHLKQAENGIFRLFENQCRNIV